MSFVRIISKRTSDNFTQFLPRISAVFNTLEYETVKQGLRDLAVIHVDPSDLLVKNEMFKKDGLIFTPVRASGYYEGFAHMHKPVVKGEPFFYYGCLTRDQKTADIFIEANGVNNANHTIIGKLLGYPECCIEYFNANFSKNYDPIWVDLEGDIKGSIFCNQMLRYFGMRVVSHLTCSPTCKRTIALGEKYIKIMEFLDAQSTSLIVELLKDTRWDSYHGAVEVDTPKFLGVSHTYPLLERKIIHFKGD